VAQKTTLVITVEKLITPDGAVMHYPAGKDITFVTSAGYFSTAIGTDTYIRTGDGWQFYAQEDFADINTDLSATDSTGS
jgi:hypothetical protein